MSLQHLAIDAITSAELTRLIETKARESAAIDYKREFALGSDEQKREFLFDVASFANAEGGDLVYGIRATDGVPEEIVGLPGFIADKEQLRMEDLLRACISPRLAGIGFHVVSAPNTHPVLIVRVPRGLATPHLVKISSWTRFYGRNSAGKYELDVTEIRRAFLASEGAFSRLRDFRLDRLRRIIADDLGIRWTSRCRAVIHLLPAATIREEMTFTLPQLQTQASGMRPLGDINNRGTHYNFDGLLVQSLLSDETTPSSIQLFRNGALEAVDATSAPHWEGKPFLMALNVEESIRSGFPGLIDHPKRLGIPPPYILGLSLLNVRGLTVFRGGQFSRMGVAPIVQDHLILPEVTVAELPIDVDVILRPLFDLIWNASGYRRSFHYDENGNWLNID